MIEELLSQTVHISMMRKEGKQVSIILDVTASGMKVFRRRVDFGCRTVGTYLVLKYGRDRYRSYGWCTDGETNGIVKAQKLV